MLEQLNELDEKHSTNLHQTYVIQQQCSKWHDLFIKKKIFQNGDWALLYDSCFKDFRGKLQTRWIGTYKVDTIFDNGTIKLTTIDDAETPIFANGHRLQLYQQPLSKEEFVSQIIEDSGYHFFDGEEIAPAPLKS